MHGFKEIFILFFRVATFKTPPQDLPASEIVLVVSVGFSLFVGLLKFAVVGSEYYSFFRVLLELIVPAALIYLLLLFFKVPNRFNQTFSSICGSGSIIYLIALPVLPSLVAAPDVQQSDLSVYLIIALNLWSLAVLAYILKHSVNVGLGTGISLAVVLVLFTMLIVERISPSARPVADMQETAGTSNPL